MTHPAAPRAGDRRIALAREWDDLVEQVRRLPGLADFLRPPHIAMLLPAASDGPVAVVNVSRIRCDALIVTSGGVEVVALPRLTLELAAERVMDYLRTVAHFQLALERIHAATEQYTAGGDRAGYLAATMAFELDCVTLEQSLVAILEWLWDAVTEPVLASLGIGAPPAGDGSWPRLWWCPIGPLTLLPLHAAGRHDTPGAAVVDRVVSSYTPTVRALLDARARPPAAGLGTMLAVGLPRTPGQAPLPHVDRELAAIRGLLPKGRRTVFAGARATVAAVRAALRAHRWVHFSCHGDQDLADPSRGGLLLHDGKLTVADIAAGQHAGDFAFLSACKTATGGTVLPDEAITLAAALHFTGYRHVIATLWSVWDDSAAAVSEAVYRDIVVDRALRPERAATALHTAVRALRDGNRARPSVWMPFTHIGP